jgi:hypothetical protein
MGAIFYLYGTGSDDILFIDRKLRLVDKQVLESAGGTIAEVKQRLRELHAE